MAFNPPLTAEMGVSAAFVERRNKYELSTDAVMEMTIIGPGNTHEKGQPDQSLLTCSGVQPSPDSDRACGDLAGRVAVTRADDHDSDLLADVTMREAVVAPHRSGDRVTIAGPSIANLRCQWEPTTCVRREPVAHLVAAGDEQVSCGLQRRPSPYLDRRRDACRCPARVVLRGGLTAESVPKGRAGDGVRRRHVTGDRLSVQQP